MERLLLESIFLVCLIILIFLYIKLFRNIIHYRRKFKVSIGDSNNLTLLRSIRAHANFNENVPFSLLVLMFLYFHNLLIFCCISILMLLVGRFLHSKGILDQNEKDKNFNFRVKGMKLTIYSYYVAIIGLVYYLAQTFYFFIKNLS
ncbi:MAG: glutathione metabolism protein [Rickettsiales bacterium]|nr:glutathione metabolism protein [Rickettsiales bacterium]OUV53744.1 MAG: hypothetical protein CBC87_03320 [Rickettsiales bacterium TMED127]